VTDSEVDSPHQLAQPPHVTGPPRSTRPSARRRSIVRHPDDKSDPVELLLDITFVALLNQASSLLFRDSSPSGIMNALSVLLAALLFWQMTAAATGIVPVDGMMRTLHLVKTGAFLVMAASVRQAFARDAGGSSLPWLFAAATTLAGLSSVVMWVYVAGRDRRWRGNASFLIAFSMVMIGASWAAERQVGGQSGLWLLLGYAVSMALTSNTALPFPARWGIGSRVPGWAINGARAYRERYTTSYVVGCVLCLQLLEAVGESVWSNEPLPPGTLIVVAVALNVSCLLYWLYEPLVEPARRLVDPRNPALAQTRKVAHSLGDVYGHTVMFAGLVLTAGALRAILTHLAEAHAGWLGPAADTETLLELFGGIALCLLGQSLFASLTTWRPDWLRLAAVLVAAVAVPVLRGRPLVLVVLALPVIVGAVYLLDRRRRVRAGTHLPRPRPADHDRLPRARRPSWRPWVRRTDHQHEVSGFELFFDFMAAFAFAQVGHVTLSNPTLPGALHALLLLGSIYGCWITYCWAANNARADTGTLRQLYVIALFGLILLSLTMPGAFSGAGLTMRAGLFLVAYLSLRLGSVAALRIMFGRAVNRRCYTIIGCGSAAAVCIAVAVSAGGTLGTVMWGVALVCEVVAVTISAGGMSVTAPAHLAERFGFLVILGLDMSLSGVCEKFDGADIGAAHVALIVADLLICTLMWWLYFDTLAHFAEHRLHHTHADRTSSHLHRRFAHAHYNALHLVILAGMVSVGFGLRFVADATVHDTTGILGPPLSPLTAVSLAGGVAAYLAGIAGMWSVLGKRTVAPWLIGAAALAATPFMPGRPAIEALAVLIAATGVPLLVRAWTPAVRAHRSSVHRQLHPARRH
jgi:low temperature requirement protein LtrA